MLQALIEADILPDLVVGTSIGAMNGAVIAAGPNEAPERLTTLWEGVAEDDTFSESVVGRLRTLARTRTHIHDDAPLRRLVAKALPVERFDQLAVPFQCVAAAIESASSHWFSEGPLLDAIMASAAVPGLLPPVRIGSSTYYDGGLVHSIPLGRALLLGAEEIFVLQVGRIEAPLRPPESPWDVGLVAFEIARRHRFVEELETVPSGVTTHVLPSGDAIGFDDPRGFRYTNTSGTRERIERAREATAAYLADRR
ncbi:MAG: patatin-like phospholipase family protein [Acidimicrobiia bacterium]|nr:patatin-like phospholipase family protein [Acidimicrobiia bacterium]